MSIYFMPADNSKLLTIYVDHRELRSNIPEL